MKIFFGIAAVMVMSFFSCKKEYQCLCSTAGSEPVVETHKGKDWDSACSDASDPFEYKACTPKN